MLLPFSDAPRGFSGLFGALPPHFPRSPEELSPLAKAVAEYLIPRFFYFNLPFFGRAFFFSGTP